MASKNFYFHIVFWIFIIAATSIGLGICYNTPDNLFFTIVLGMVLFTEICLFIYNFNSINRKIASFFNAIQNEDTSIFFLPDNTNKSVKEVQLAMNKAIAIFQKIKMESEMRQQFFSAMIEHSSTGFISIDEHGDFEIINETARKLLGLIYTSNMERLQKDSPQLYKTLINLKYGEVKSCQIENAGISTIIQVSSSSLSFKDKKITLISLLDIKKEIESRELKSWQKLIRILNHEIMNSIAPITSVSKSLITIFKKKDSHIQFSDLDDKKICDVINGLEVIESMSSGLSNFVNHYRQLSKVPDPVINKINIEQWGKKLTTISNDILKENNARLEITLHPGVSHINGDENLLTQVLINLIKNAAEAPLNGEKKIISIDFHVLPNNQTIIKVWNNGQIISPEILDQLFVPFFTTKEKGAGIGLFVSRQIINLHHGTISVISNSNEGTFFSIEF